MYHSLGLHPIVLSGYWRSPVRLMYVKLGDHELDVVRSIVNMSQGSSSRLELLEDSDSDTSFLTTSSTSFSQREAIVIPAESSASPQPVGIQLLRATRRDGEGRRYPFARDVVIQGWKVVGGEKWQDAAKVGAYVGEPFNLNSVVLMKVYDIVIDRKSVV